MKLTLFKSLSLTLALMTVLTLLSTQVTAHSITAVDGMFDDWFPTTPVTAPGANYPASTGRVARNTQQQGEFIWRDASRDQRLIATKGITEDVDLRTFRVTADKTNLHMQLKVENVTNNSGAKAPEFQVAIDTTRDGTGNTALVNTSANATPVNTNVDPQAAWEFLVQTNFRSANTTAPYVYTGPTTRSTVGSGYLRTSGDDSAELSIPWSRIGGAPGATGKRLRFSVATLYSDGTDTAVPLVNGSRVMDTMNAQKATDDLTNADNTIGYYADVTFDANGEVVAPLVVSEFMPNPPGKDDPAALSASSSEWIEIYNPNPVGTAPIDVSSYKIGNAAQRREGSQAMLKFPANTTIAAKGVLVIARDKAKFQAAYPSVPSGSIIAESQLTAYLPWASNSILDLGNGPEEEQILLLDNQDTIVDMVTYAAPAANPSPTPGTVAIALPATGIAEDVSYERCPATRDTNDNTLDFIQHADRATHTPGVACSGNTDLAIALAAPGTAAVNRNFSYVLTYSSTGANTDNAYITTTLPANITYVANSQVVGANPGVDPTQVQFTQTGNVLVWRFPRMSNGSGTITFSALVENNASIIGQDRVATAQIQGSLPDPTPANNSATATTRITDVPQVNVGVVKQLTSSPTSLFNGRQAVYTLTYSNTGDLAAENSTITDQVPAGLTFVSASPVQPQVSGSNLVFNLGTLALPLNQTIVLTFTVSAPDAGGQTIANTAAIATSTTPEIITTNNTSTDTRTTVAAPTVDLSLVKTADRATAKIGETVGYTLQVSNSGVGTATNITLVDTLPAGLTYVAGSAGSVGEPSISGNVLTWGPLAGFSVGPKATASVTFRAKIAEVDADAVLVNHAQVSAAGDPNTADNSADSNATTALAGVDLELTKTANTDTVAVGDDVTFTFTLNNTGIDTATSIQVVDTLPAGLTYKAGSTSSSVGEPQVSSDGRTVTWTLPTGLNVAPGETKSFSFKTTARGNQGDMIVNTAVATTIGDANSINNTASSAEVMIQGIGRGTVYLPIVVKPAATK